MDKIKEIELKLFNLKADRYTWKFNESKEYEIEVAEHQLTTAKHDHIN